MSGRWRVSALAALASVLVLLAASCGQAPFTITAAGPYTYPAPATINPALERVAIVITIASRSGDDLQINPADFAARDADHRLYAANATATTTDASLVLRVPELRGTLPLPVVTLRRDDVLTGFVVFDVPAGVRLVELIWRQVDSDYTVRLDGES